MVLRTYSTYIYENFLNKDIPRQSKKKNKLSNENFEEKNIDLSDFLEYDFNISQLKILNKNFNLKTSGNKKQLLLQIYNYKYYSNFINTIQRYWRGYFQRKFNNLHGPAFIKREICINDTDFFTLDDCKSIKYENFFSFKDDLGYIYGFDILSIYNLFIKKGTNTVNPYTNKIFPPNILNNLKNIIKYNKIFDIDFDLTLNKDESYLKKQQLELRVLSLFQVIDSLDNYTQINWLLDLDKNKLIRFIRELYDIWNYRADLSQNVKREICPPNGNPFKEFNVNHLLHYSYNYLLKNILFILENFVKKGINRDSQILGSWYVLSALTLVNQEAAEALPLLYQSVLAN